MIDELEVGRFAHFHREGRRLSSAVVACLFAEMRTRPDEPSGDVLRLVRENTVHSVLSGICFSHQRLPPFLLAGSERRNRVGGDFLLMERGRPDASVSRT